MKAALVSICLLVALARGLAADLGHRLHVAVVPRFNGSPLTFDVVTNVTAQGQQISVTRLDFLLSNIALRRADGGWPGLSNWFAYISGREGRTTFELNNLPAGHYDRLRFHIGVPANVNHADPAQHPPGHPLNPTVNGLHWDWQGGYVFFALEGNWTLPVRASSQKAAHLANADGGALANRRYTGYSYHIATDRQLMAVELPMTLDLTADREVTLALDIAKVFAGPHTIQLTESTSTTHSGQGDDLADQFRQNIEHAFTIAVRGSVPAHEQALQRFNALTVQSDRLEMASNATPYRLTFSRSFPLPALPKDNPLTEEGVRLGALLFFDTRLSVNNSQACASCHQPAAAFADSGKTFSRGAEGHLGDRNAMPLFNLAWKSSFFWDGRAASLRDQVLQPIQNPIEMHETLENVAAKLTRSRVNARHQARVSRVLAPPISAPASTPGASTIQRFNDSTPSPQDYPSLFSRAFGTPDITPDRVARALEQFLLTRVSHHSKFDRFIAGQAQLTAEEKRGLELFRTEYDPRRGQFGADCFHCHGGPLFQNVAFANNGLETDFKDPGRYLATQKEGDKGKFAVPSLRNVALTAPYMHDGRFTTLEAVIEHYATGVKRSTTLDPNLAKHPTGGLPLSAADKRALVAFLNTLSDEHPVREPGVGP